MSADYCLNCRQGGACLRGDGYHDWASKYGLNISVPMQIRGHSDSSQPDLDFLGWRGDGVHPYPATMPYPLAENLVLRYSKPGDRILDPFVGSGTTIRAAAAAGRLSIGIDLNPLATLMARVSVQPLDVQRDIPTYRAATTEVMRRVGRNTVLPADHWEGRLKTWFAPDAQHGLSRVAAALSDLLNEGDLPPHLIDYLLLAFSRAVRLCSLARPGELKLWRRPKPHNVENAEVVFDHEATELLQTLIAFHAQHHIRGEWQPTVITGDSEHALRGVPKAALVLTSPPYGDSWTTVAYGNFSLLSRIWLSAVDPAFAENDPATEDARAIGGSKRERAGRTAPHHGVADLSENLRRVLPEVAKGSQARAKELELFVDDMWFILAEIAGKLRADGRLILVVGPRRVAGIPVDTGMILGDLIAHLGLGHVDRQVRRVTGKRLPSRTSQGGAGIAETINRETIDVFERIRD